MLLLRSRRLESFHGNVKQPYRPEIIPTNDAALLCPAVFLPSLFEQKFHTELSHSRIPLTSPSGRLRCLLSSL